MEAVDVFVTVYLIAVMIVLGILSTLSYRKRAKNGELDD